MKYGQFHHNANILLTFIYFIYLCYVWVIYHEINVAFTLDALRELIGQFGLVDNFDCSFYPRLVVSTQYHA
jgi:hypothetical protein